MNRWHDPVPGEHDAGERTWELVRAAYATRERLPRPHRRPRRTLMLAGAAAVVAAAFGAAGAAVVHSLQGEQNTRTALSSLPGGGRLLLVSRSGAWIVHADGSKRRLGQYEDAVWSPHGKFVAATRGHELYALDPEGGVRWSLARRGHVRLPSWYSPSGYRIAYLAGAILHVVAGNGTGDRALADAVPAVRPAWRPGSQYELAFADGTGVRVVETDANRLVWRRRLATTPTQLTWSADGTRLIVLAPSFVRVFDQRGRLVAQGESSDATTAAAAAFVGNSKRIAEIRVHVHGDRSDLFLLDEGTTLYDGVGRFSGLAWSPNGKWFVLGWPTANTLLFVPSTRPRKIVGFSGIAATFGSFPELRGWMP
jgi:hypothetical protein